jgi:hypothetical protein
VIQKVWGRKNSHIRGLQGKQLTREDQALKEISEEKFEIFGILLLKGHNGKFDLTDKKEWERTQKAGVVYKM